VIYTNGHISKAQRAVFSDVLYCDILMLNRVVTVQVEDLKEVSR